LNLQKIKVKRSKCFIYQQKFSLAIFFSADLSFHIFNPRVILLFQKKHQTENSVRTTYHDKRTTYIFKLFSTQHFFSKKQIAVLSLFCRVSIL